ncbi:MAG: hypothetical protein KDB37_20700 [Ilumatobacter sp.]|nr:hypothetical protein [Ilumatobacter sp.]
MDNSRRFGGLRLALVMALLVPVCVAVVVADDLGDAPVVDAADGDVVPVVPARLLETRPGEPTFDGNEFGSDTSPWMPGGNPLSQAGSVFGHDFDCGLNELTMYPDGLYSTYTTFWTRIS